MSVSAIDRCQHTEHLFEHPLCQHQPLLQRIGIVAFHVFTFFIPLMVYHIVHAVFPRGHQFQETEEEPLWIPIEPVRNVEIVPLAVPDYSAIANFALIYARNLLSARPHIEAQLIIPEIAGQDPALQPINEEIAKLVVLEKTELYPRFERLIRENPHDTWNHPNVLEAADQYLKVSFAISALTLDDLPQLAEMSRELGNEHTYPELITMQNSYVKRTFLSLTSAYHTIRCGIYYNPGTERGWAARLVKPEHPPHAHTRLFYENQSIHSQWNQLYNEFCDRVSHYASYEAIERENELFLPWIMKDEAPEDFRTTPGPLPA